MTANPIWTTEQLVERLGTDWPVRVRAWAVEELATRAPQALLKHGRALIEPESDRVLREAAASHLARHADAERAAELVEGFEPQPPLLPLLLRAADPRGDRLARRMGAWWSWSSLNRDGFVAWLEGSKPDADPDLAATIAEHLVHEGVPALVGAVLRHDAEQLADEFGAYLHLAATGMEGAFADDAGARGVAALRSPFFEMSDEVSERFQALGSLPPSLPRSRFVPQLREIWGQLFDDLDDDSDRALFEMLRDVSIDVMTAEGPTASEAAARLANRAVAAGILRAGIDAAFAGASDDDARLEVWLSFSEAGFRRADQLFFHPDSETELVDGVIELVARAIRDSSERGLAAAMRLAWYVVEQMPEGADSAAPPLVEALIERIEEDASVFVHAVMGEGYREFIAAAPGATLELAKTGLSHESLAVVRETLSGLQSSGSSEAAELVADHLVELLRRDPSPHAPRALAILASPPHLERLIEVWAPGEPTLASYALSAAEIIGEEVPDAIEREGEEAYEENRETDEITGGGEDLERTLETMRARFRALLRCTECSRVGRYDVPKIVIDPRSVGEHQIDGKVVPNRPVTCKFCGAEEAYEVVRESNFYLFPHLIAFRSGDDEARVLLTRLELSDGTEIETATQAVWEAEQLAQAGGAEEWHDLLRVAEVFAEPEAYDAIRERAADQFPEVLERFDATPSLAASFEEVDSYMAQSARSLGRKAKGERVTAAKIGRYGVAAAWLSDDGIAPNIGVALARKMPKGRVAIGWMAINRSERSVVHAGAEFGMKRDDVDELLARWNGAPFELADPERVGRLLGDALRGMVGRGRPVPTEVVVFWPFFEAAVTG